MANVYANAIVFFITWILSIIIWAFWLDGVYIPIAGAITGVVVVGGNVAIHLHRK